MKRTVGLNTAEARERSKSRYLSLGSYSGNPVRPYALGGREENAMRLPSLLPLALALVVAACAIGDPAAEPALRRHCSS